MDWLKQHGDTIVILSTFAVCFWTLNEKIMQIDKDLTIIKTVLVLKNIMPSELCKNSETSKVEEKK